MASDAFPELSTAEWIRYGLVICLWALACDVAAVLVLGTGLSHAIVWGVAAVAGVLASRAVLFRWARSKGRPILTREQAAQTFRAAWRSWPLSLTLGFVWGFTVLGADSHLPMSNAPDWNVRAVQGVIGAIVVALFARPWRKPENLSG